MHEQYSWRKCRGLIFREYLKFCVPPLFQSVFKLTKGKNSMFNLFKIPFDSLFSGSFCWMKDESF